MKLTTKQQQAYIKYISDLGLFMDNLKMSEEEWVQDELEILEDSLIQTNAT